MDKFYMIPNTNNRYSINKYGKIRANYKNLIMKLQCINGYLTVQFNINKKIVTKRINRLLAEIFIPNPNKFSEINHKDGNKLNNNLSNLEWCTHKENMKHASKMGLLGIKIKQMPKYWNYTLAEYNSISEASRKTGVHLSNIQQVISGKRKYAGGYKWKRV